MYRRALVIMNPVSGQHDPERTRRLIARRFGEEGLEYQLKETQDSGDAFRWAEAAAGEGFDVVVAVGGDGTIMEDSAGQEIDLDSADSGCMGEAGDEVYGEGTFDAEEFDFGQFDGLWSDIGALHDRIRRDPRIEEALGDWRNCMAGAGYPDFETPEAAQSSVFDRVMEATSAGDDKAAIVIGDSADNIDPATLREIQEYEIDVATADFTCNQEHLDETYREVAHQMEQEFVDANRAELERYRDWLAESGGAAG
jgi:hypothetical protein